jgi:heme-degrading monooxygenase HmoA
VYLILWEYHVKPEKQAEFEQVYSHIGVWAGLFQKGAGYLGTELLRDEKNPLRYVTIDRWKSKAEYKMFLSQWKQEYEALDSQCEGLTERESLLGKGLI